MSSDIWMLCEGKSKIVKLHGLGYRIVEDQARSSTFKLIDSEEEHELLENLLEESKPKLSEDLESLHYLLFTPFRYPPLDYGSRFGSVHERGIFYGSETIPTSLAEKAFYLFYFMSGSSAKFEPSDMWFTVFSFEYATLVAIDLTKPPFKKYEKKISDPISYRIPKKLGSAMREAAIDAFLFISARDPKKGKNLGIFSPQAFQKKNVEDVDKTQWYSSVSQDRMFFQRGKETHRFERSDFLVNGSFPVNLS